MESSNGHVEEEVQVGTWVIFANIAVRAVVEAPNAMEAVNALELGMVLDSIGHNVYDLDIIKVYMNSIKPE